MNRTRSRGTSPTYETCRLRFTPVSGPVSYSESTPYIAYYNEETISDDISRSRSVKHCSHSKSLQTSASGTGTLVGPGVGTYAFIGGNPTEYYLNVPRHHTVGSMDFSTVNLDSLISKAKIEALNKIDKSSFAFLEDVFEAKKTLSLLKNITDPLYTLNKNLVRDFNRGRHKGLASADAFAKAWLVSKYGYGNVIRSSLNAVESYNSRNRVRPVQRRSGSQDYGDEQNLSYTERRFHFASETQGVDLYEVKRRRAFKVNAGVYYVDKKPMETFSHTHGLQMKDIPKTIWQVLPYSWVTDRFVDIGASIGAAMKLADPEYQITDGWVNVEAVYENSITLTATLPNGWSSSVSGGPKVHNFSTYHRERWTPTWSDVIPVPDVLHDVRKTLSDVNNILDFTSLLIPRLRLGKK